MAVPRTLGESPGSMCSYGGVCYYVRGVGVMRGRGQMLKIYLPVQPRGMAGGTAVGADDRSMGRGPRLSQSRWVIRKRERVIGNRAAAGEGRAQPIRQRAGQTDALGGSQGGWVVRLSGWRNDGSLGKGEEGWENNLGAGWWLKRGPDRGRRVVGREEQGSLGVTIGFIRHSQ